MIFSIKIFKIKRYERTIDSCSSLIKEDSFAKALISTIALFLDVKIKHL